MADWLVTREHVNMKASHHPNMLKQNAANKQEFRTPFHFLQIKLLSCKFFCFNEHYNLQR